MALIGRHAPDESAEMQIEELRSAGASVEIYQTDVTDRARLEHVLDEIRKQPGPLQGVVHAAGVLDDGTIAQMDWPRSRAVLSPKLDGAWNLHRCTFGDSSRLSSYSLRALRFSARRVRGTTQPPMLFWMRWPIIVMRRDYRLSVSIGVLGAMPVCRRTWSRIAGNVWQHADCAPSRLKKDFQCLVNC